MTSINFRRYGILETRVIATSLPKQFGNTQARRLFYTAVCASFIAGALFAIQALLLSEVVNRVFLKKDTLANTLPLLVLMLALMLARAGCIWLSDVLAQRSASLVKQDLRQRLTRRLFILGPAYTRSQRTGELVNLATQGIEAQDEYITQYQMARYLAFLAPAFVFLLVLLLDPWSTLILLIAGAFLLLLLALIGGRARVVTQRRFLELSWMSAFFLDILQGLATLKMFGRSKEQAANIEEISQHYGKTTMEVLATAFQSSLVMELAATAATAMAALEVSLRLMNGGLSFTRALAVLLLTPEFFLPLRQFAIRYHAGTTGKAATERIFAILDTAPQVNLAANQVQSEGQIARPGSLESSSGEQVKNPAGMLSEGIRFENVSFAYPSPEDDSRRQVDGRSALEDFTITLPRGQTTTLVGETGAGKTTVASLLLRFIDPQQGQITVSGIPLAAIEPAAWRRQVAWVPQLPHLFHGTLADNLRLGKPEASLDELIAAAQAANAHEFIQALPQGYDTLIGEGGARLSGGERGRIALGRAFLKNAPLLILDEASANLDRRNQELFQEALSRLMSERTVLMIAHRMELAFTAGQVVVMENGRAIESGTHPELLRLGGVYWRMVQTYGGNH